MRWLRSCVAWCTIALLVGCTGRSGGPAAVPVLATSSAAVERYLASIRDDSARLGRFLREMPKGGDLHNHLGGAVYAESMIGWAGDDGLCLTLSTLALTAPPCAASDGRPAASGIEQNSDLYGRVIDAWSMRHFDVSHALGHDHFFGTFAKFGPATTHHLAEMLAEATSRAANDQLSYLELMQTLDGSLASTLGIRLGFNGQFAEFRERLLRAGLRDSLVRIRSEFHAAEQRRLQLQRCGTGQPDPGCRVTVRFLYQVLRGLPPSAVFAQILTGFELASTDSDVVGFNLVMPEDAVVPMRDFALHMQMIDFLHALYPAVHISLHAGELVGALVPAAGLTFHIRESIEVGHAERIGHGVDVMHERDATGLLQEMAARHILVEVALTSNDGILGVRGADHPLASYLRYGVPVALVTDDEGVSRSDMTHEFQRAVRDQHVDYATLRTMARNSLVYSFAAPAEKVRLLAAFDAAIGRFEAKWHGQ